MTGFGGQSWTAAGSVIGGIGAGLELGGGRFGEDGWAAVGSARRWGAGRRQVCGISPQKIRSASSIFPIRIPGCTTRDSA